MAARFVEEDLPDAQFVQVNSIEESKSEQYQNFLGKCMPLHTCGHGDVATHSCFRKSCRLADI